MRTIHPCWLIAAALLVCTTWNSAKAQTTARIPPAGGAVLAEDGKTLIVSARKHGLLVYFDTIEEKEIKRVELDFLPDKLAVQGQKLFASVKGAGKLFVLNAETGEEIRAVKLGSDPIESLACHPTKGLLYACDKGDNVFSIDPEKGKVKKTKAKGQKLLVDPADGDTVYTGIQRPIREVIVIREGPNKSLRVSLDKANLNALMMKFKVKGADLEPLAANENAAINGKEMGISPDGQRVAMAGGGGWMANSETPRTYSIAVYETEDMTSLAGQIELGPYPAGVAWHPQLNLGVAKRFIASELVFFNGKSLAEKSRVKVEDGDPVVLLFAAQGTKLACVSPVAPMTDFDETMITLVPLELTDEDRAKLKKAYEE